VLHEIHDTKDRSVLIAGVMDGHGGTAASSMASNEITSVLSNQFVVNRKNASDALADSWDIVCKSYQQQCMNEDEECVAEYDPREGILMANNGSEDLIAGTTASIMALDERTGKLTLLNCGDSRSMVVTPEGKVEFVTEDHTPQSEEERLMEGVKAGLQYSLPKCRISKWSISVGDYEYSVGRSLEGPFATSKGLVSAPDVTTLSVTPGEALVSASDGLWGVMDSDEVALHLYKMRKKGMPARDAARALCSLALKKGTPDNVSAVVVFL
jgi:serine/threonine protein phosphatase PrpC